MSRPKSAEPVSEREFREAWKRAIAGLGLRNRHVDMIFDKANDDEKSSSEPACDMRHGWIQRVARSDRMKNHESRLQAARRKVAEQEMLIAIYRETVVQFEEQGQPSEVARKALEAMERTLIQFRDKVSRLSN